MGEEQFSVMRTSMLLTLVIYNNIRTYSLKSYDF